VALLRQAPEQARDIAAERAARGVRDVEPEAVDRGGQRHGAVDLEVARVELDQRNLSLVELVRDRAHDLLQRVFQEREAERGTKLVDGDGDVRARALKLGDELA